MIKITKAHLNRLAEVLYKLEIQERCFDAVRIFKRILVNDFGYSKLNADLIALQYNHQVKDVVFNVIAKFERLGIPPPYLVTETNVILNHNHKAHDVGINWEEYKKLLVLFENADPVEFLFLSAATLYADNATKICLVDGSYDGGIDLVALCDIGTMSKRVIFGQSKKAINGVNKETLIYEDSYFKDQIRRTEKHSEYLALLGVTVDSVANDISYCFYTNVKISQSAHEYARKNMVRIRVGCNMAAAIARIYNFNEISSWVNWLKNQNYKDLRMKELPPPQVIKI